MKKCRDPPQPGACLCAGPGSEPAFQSPPLKAYPAEKGPQSEGAPAPKTPACPQEAGAALGLRGPSPARPPLRPHPTGRPKDGRGAQRPVQQLGAGLQGWSSRTRTPGSQASSTSDDSTMLTPLPARRPHHLTRPATLHRKPALAGQPVVAPPTPGCRCEAPTGARPAPSGGTEVFRGAWMRSLLRTAWRTRMMTTHVTAAQRTQSLETFFTPPSPLAPL